MDGELHSRGLERRVARLEGRVLELELLLGAAAEAPPAPAVLPAAPEPEQPGAPVTLYREPPLSRRSPDVATPLPPSLPAVSAVPAPPPSAPRPGWVERPSAPEPAPEPMPSISLRDLEERFAGRALAWIGGFALVAAAVFFLSLAFSRGWITEPMRVVIGLVAGSVALGVGALSFDRRNPLLGNVLTAVGLGIVSIALFAATRVYGLVPPEVGLAGALTASIAAAVVAIRYDAREVAAFGLIAALIAPPVMGASPTTLTLLFVAVTLVGTTAIALFRSWRWLPSIAFILAAPQLAHWLAGGADTAQALIALTGFWLVNIVAAAGEEVRIRRDDLRPSSAMLVLANAAFLLWGGDMVLGAGSHPWLGLFVAVAALAHLAVGGAFLRRQGLDHLFGNLVAGTGAALLALAAFIQLGAALVPVAWGAEAAALAWLAARRRHVWSGLAGVALGSLAILHIVLVEYPLDALSLSAGPLYAPALLHPGAASLLAVLAAMAVSGALVPVISIRSALAALGALLIGYAATFEVTGPPLIATLVVVAIAVMELDRVIVRRGSRPDLAFLDGLVPARYAALGSAAVLRIVAIAALLVTAYPPSSAFAPPAVPYTDQPALSLAILLAGLAVAGERLGTRSARSVVAAAGVLLVTWSVPFETTGTLRIGLGAVLLPLAVLVERAIARTSASARFAYLRLPADLPNLVAGTGAVPWLLSFGTAAVKFFPFGRWGLDTPPAIPFTDDTALVAALLAGSAVAAAAWLVSARGRQLVLLAAIVPVALAVPFEVYADFVVVLWLLLAAVALAVTRSGDRLRALSVGLAGSLGVGAAIVAFGIVAPPDRLWVAEYRAPLLAGWWLALAAVASVPLIASRRPFLAPHRSWLEVTAAAVGVYLLSIGVVDAFQRSVGGTVPTEELAKQAQVALSVTWTAVGAIALAIGLRTRHAMPRHIGFGLLALATAKVFVVDLAAMDVAYRAVVLAGLGELLLVSAWLVTHLRGPRAGTPGVHGARPA